MGEDNVRLTASSVGGGTEKMMQLVVHCTHTTINRNHHHHYCEPQQAKQPAKQATNPRSKTTMITRITSIVLCAACSLVAFSWKQCTGLLIPPFERQQQQQQQRHKRRFILTPSPPLCSMSLSSNDGNDVSSSSKEIYGIQGSGWSSADWKWGGLDGTAHECIQICRQLYSTSESRAALIDNLMLPVEDVIPENNESPSTEAAAAAKERLPSNFEEVKLVLALAFEKSRREEGDLAAYGVVLDAMVDANRYEEKEEQQKQKQLQDNGSNYRYQASMLLVQDMQKRFFWLNPNVQDKISMSTLTYEGESDSDWIRRRCAGLVLKAMDFEIFGFDE